QTLAHLVSLRLSLGSDTGAVSGAWKAEFEKHVNNDLDTPGALATLWNMTRDSALSDAEKLSTLLDMDRVLGLSLQEPDGQLRTLAGAAVKESDLPEPVRELLRQREIARHERNFEESDALRARIVAEGYDIEDTAEGPRISKTLKIRVTN